VLFIFESSSFDILMFNRKESMACLMVVVIHSTLLLEA
jgi:hypothetical protein